MKENKMTIDPKLLDAILNKCKTPDDLIGVSGALKQIQKTL